MSRIIYPYKDTIAVVYPDPKLPLEECCKKDVPAGVPYLVIEDDDVPTDRTFRNAWEADFSTPDGYGIGAKEWFKNHGGQQQMEMIDGWR